MKIGTTQSILLYMFVDSFFQKEEGAIEMRDNTNTIVQCD